mmetsp:Transcript_73953/g.124538  ORF Transcript_73953/g.124538 Transcript_73953/m.124538 type:complete len:320 (+) Transcript_73953:453-1412(+)
MSRRVLILEPEEVFAQGCSVADMAPPHAPEFHIVLDRLGKHDQRRLRRALRLWVVLQDLAELHIAERRVVAVAHGPLRRVCQHVSDLLVRQQGHVRGGQMRRHLRSHFGGVHEDLRRAITTGDAVREEHGVEIDVSTAQVQQPRNVVQSGEEDAILTGSLQLLRQIRQLVYHRLPCVFHIMNEHRVFGHGGHGNFTVLRPNFVHKVAVQGLHLDPLISRFLLECGRELAVYCAGHCPGIKTDYSPSIHVGSDPVVACGDSRLPPLHKGPHGGLQLLRRLKEISTVSPQQSLLLRDHYKPEGPIEAGDVASLHVSLWRVL